MIEHGRVTDGSRILASLRSKEATPDDDDVVFQRRAIETALELESAGWPFQYSELFGGGKLQNLRRMILCGAVNVMQQFTGKGTPSQYLNFTHTTLGSNFINYYAPIVYQRTVGLSRNLSLILGGCTSLTYLLGSIIPLFVVDRLGRRPLLMFSAAGLCLCFSLAAILLSLGTVSTAYGATAMVFLFQIFLGLGWLPIPWFFGAEICTTRIRSRGQAFGGFMNCMPFCSGQLYVALC